jgi:hypothetical protein
MPMRTVEEQRAYQLGYIKGVRKQWFEENGPCAKCGSWEDLELDHVNRNEKRTHRVWSLSAEARKTELAKCQVLCKDCHKEKTLAELTKPLVHGTANGYKGKRCRCDACRQWNTDSHRERRERRKADSSGVTRTPDLSIMSGTL